MEKITKYTISEKVENECLSEFEAVQKMYNISDREYTILLSAYLITKWKIVLAEKYKCLSHVTGIHNRLYNIINTLIKMTD